MSFSKIFVFVFFLGLTSCRPANESPTRGAGSDTPPPSAQSGNAGSAMPPPAASAPVEAAGSYDKNGVSFVLRKNWKVTEDENVSSGVRYLSIEDDKTATVAVTLLPTGTNPDLKKYAAEFLGAMKTNLSGGTLTPTGESAAVRLAANVEKKGIAEKFTISLAGQSVPHTAELFLNKGRKYDAVIIYNAPDDEKSVADTGFETILYTLKTE